MRAAIRVQFSDRDDGKVSIRAAHAGSDIQPTGSKVVVARFNPRCPCGQRSLQVWQSLDVCVVSIRAAHAGSDTTYPNPCAAKALGRHFREPYGLGKENAAMSSIDSTNLLVVKELTSAANLSRKPSLLGVRDSHLSDQGAFQIDRGFCPHMFDLALPVLSQIVVSEAVLFGVNNTL